MNQLKFQGLAYTVISALSILANMVILYAFAKKPVLLRGKYGTVNSLVAILILLNLVSSILAIPPIALSNFYEKWIFPDSYCHLNGFIIYWVGCVGIYLLSCISYERLIQIKWLFDEYTVILHSTCGSFSEYQFDRRRRMAIYLNKSDLKGLKTFVVKNEKSRSSSKLRLPMLIFICFLLGSIWPTIPFIGWSKYSMDKANTSCAIDWRSSGKSKSYNITVLVFVLIIPGLFIIATNILLLFQIKRQSAKWEAITSLISQQTTRKRRLIKIRTTYKVTFVIAAFGLSWLPYGILSCYLVFVDQQGVNQLLETLSTVLAKSSVLWTGLALIVADENIKRTLSNIMKR